MYTKINDLIVKYPRVINYFYNKGLDLQTIKNRNLKQVFNSMDMDFNTGDRELKEYIRINYDRDTQPSYLSEYTLSELTEHIVKTHHGFEKKLLNDIEYKIELLIKNDSKDILMDLKRIVREIKSEINVHFIEEEMDLFPAISLSDITGVYNYTIISAIEKAEKSHSIIGSYISELIEMTYDFSIRDDNELFNFTIMELDEFVKDLFLHIYIENTMLYEKYEIKYGK